MTESIGYGFTFDRVAKQERLCILDVLFKFKCRADTFIASKKVYNMLFVIFIFKQLRR